jgi:hypothetical protein
MSPLKVIFGLIGLIFKIIFGILRLFFGGKKKKRSGWKLWQVIAIGLALALAAYSGKTVVHSVQQHISPAHSSKYSGTLDCAQLEGLWESAGGSPSEAFMAAEVARAESAGDQYSRDPSAGTYGNGTVDEGYWQINTVHSKELATHGLEVSYDPLMNAKDAVFVSDDGTNWEPWVTWQHGKEIGQC